MCVDGNVFDSIHANPSIYFKLNSNADCYVDVDDQWGRRSYFTMSAQTMTYGIRKK